MRILGLDYGSKTVGVAVSDGLGLTAQGIEIIRRDRESKLRRTIARIRELIEEYQVQKIVMGLPFNMDGSAGGRVEKTLEFKSILEDKTGLPVIMWDERLTSVEAHDILSEAGISRSEHDRYVDKVAAVLILQDYLNAQE